MIIRTFIIISSLLILLSGCKKETDTPVDKDKALTPVKNSPPGSFTIRVLNTSYNYAVIEWEPAIDADKDTLYYTVYLNDAIIAKDLKVDTILRIDNLKPEKEYFGKVEVTDRKSNPGAVLFSFKTGKYFLTFNKLYNIENSYTSGYSIEKTSDGGYIVGSEATVSDIAHSLWILKLDSLGYEQWHTTCSDHMSNEIRIKQTNDNGFILVDKAKLIKLDQTGKEAWRYPGNADLIEYCSVIQTEDNNYMALRTVYDGGLKVSVSKFDGNGGLKWEKFYKYLTRTSAKYIEKTSDGNYVIVGTEGTTEEREDFFALKINDDGDILWKKTYTDKAYAFANQIKLTSDNGFIICGTSMGYLDIVSVRILKIDPEGNLTWDKTFLWDSFKTYAFSIEQTNDGGYVFSGGNGYATMTGLLVKLDPVGGLVWKKEYKPTDYLDYSWPVFDVKKTSDGGLIMSGGKGSVWGFGPKQTGLWVLKTDASGNY
jgi:hypothetical protein